MESDEFETINSIENWLSAPLETPQTAILTGAVGANAAAPPPLSVAEVASYGTDENLCGMSSQSAVEVESVTSNGGGTLNQERNQTNAAAVFETASFGPIAHGDGIDVAGN
jgi:hypothetical protein